MAVDFSRSIKKLGDAQAAAISAQVTLEAQARLDAEA